MARGEFSSPSSWAGNFEATSATTEVCQIYLVSARSSAQNFSFRRVSSNLWAQSRCKSSFLRLAQANIKFIAPMTKRSDKRTWWKMMFRSNPATTTIKATCERSEKVGLSNDFSLRYLFLRNSFQLLDDCVIKIKCMTRASIAVCSSVFTCGRLGPLKLVFQHHNRRLSHSIGLSICKPEICTGS